jgi:hypothetical protein
MDSRADRAIIVRPVRGMLNWILLGRGRLRRRHAGDGGAACELFEVDVSKRKGKLQRHRCKREPTPTPLSGLSQTHWQNASTPAWDSLPRSRSRTNTFRSKTFLASLNWLDCCPNVTTPDRPTLRQIGTIFASEPRLLRFLSNTSPRWCRSALSGTLPEF